MKSQFFAKFYQATKQGKTSYSAHVQEKKYDLPVCLKESIAKSMADPHDSSLDHNLIQIINNQA